MYACLDRTRRALAGSLLLAAAGMACFGGPRGGNPSDPAATPPRQRNPMSGSLDVTGLYRQAGLIAEAAPLPFVGDVRFLAGPSSDSTLVLLTLSLPNRALTFASEGEQQRAMYAIALDLRQGAATVKHVTAHEVVRVGSYRETQRADESIIFQQFFTAPPGQYVLSVSVRDEGSARNASHELLVSIPRLGGADGPAAGARALSSLVTVYEATPRTDVDSLPRLIANPRSTVVFGRDSLVRVYLEGYGLASGTRIALAALNQRREPVWTDTVTLARRSTGGELAGDVLELPTSRVGVGQLAIAATIVGAGGAAGAVPDTVRAPLFVTFGEDWAILGYEEMLNFLRFFATDARLQTLRNAPAEQRAAFWGTFWRETDPDPGTSEHEALRDYFSRIQVANERFREEGVPGWLSDRGMVYVTLGEPDQLLEQGETNFSQRGRAQIWEYSRHRLQLIFIDQSGFGRWRLTSGSEVDFQVVARRERR